MYNKKISIKLFAISAVAMLAFVRDIAAEEKIRFITMGAREGLVNQGVSAMVQDKAGFIWLGTQGGVQRWDGKSFVLYENEPFNPNSIPHNQVQSMYLDNDGETLWIGTYGGLAKIESRTGKISSWSHEDKNPDSLSNDIVVSIGQDSLGRLWVGTLDGLDRKEGERFVHYRTGSNSEGALASSLIRSIFNDSRGSLWIGTGGGGLYKYLPEEDRFKAYRASDKTPGRELPSDYVYSIKEDHEGYLWLGLWYYGLARLDPATEELINYPLPDQRVYFINADDSGYIRAGTWGDGLYELDLVNGSLNHYKKTEDWQWSLPNNTAYSMLKDRSGNLWIGTNGGGFSLILKEGGAYSIYEHDPLNPGSRSPGRTYSVLEDSKGRLWIATYNGGLDRLDPGENSFVHYRYDAKNPNSLPNDIVAKVYEDSKGNKWVLTNDGLALYDEKKDNFSIFRNDPNNPASIAGNTLQNMLEEPGTGNLWIATYNKGLEYWDRQNNIFYHYEHVPGDPKSIAANLSFALVYDNKGRLWVGTNQGLCRYEGNGEFVRYITDKTNPKSLPSQNIRYLLKDHIGRLWVGTDSGGVALYNEEEDNFSHWTKKDGLASNSIISLLEDKNNNIWAISTNGIAILDHYSKVWRFYLDQSRLRYGDFSRGSFIGRDGSVYIGATNALYKINSAFAVEKNASFPVVLTKIEAKFEDLETGLAPWFTDSIKLPWQKNDLALSFAALDYEDPYSIQYAYQLDGHDKDWIYSGSRSFASYTNLRGGKYVFKIKASKGTGSWVEAEQNLHIKVETAPWLSIWAIFVYIGIGLMALWLFSAVRSSKLLKGQVDELSEIKTQLEDANLKLEDLATKDGLTGLNNRRALDRELSKHFEAAVLLKEPLAALMMDIDHFKAFNDRYGHQAGDECLVAVSQILKEVLERPKDSLSRYGGEEFLALLPGTDIAGAMLVAERMRKAVLSLQIPHESSGVSSFVSISVGYASFAPKKDMAADKIIDMADEALYRAKKGGRNRISD